MNVTPGDSGVDLSTVTAASFKVRKGNGSLATWSATRSNQTANTLTCTYTLTSTDVDHSGRYVYYIALTIPSGTVRTKPRVLEVRGLYEIGADT